MRIAIFLFGGFGGICPILVDRAKGVIVGDGLVWFTGPDWQAAIAVFLIGAGCFFLLGAIVALAHRETDYWKAVVIGVSAPGLITAAAGNEGAHNKSAPVERAGLTRLGVTAAYAQQPPSGAPFGGYQLNVAPGGGAGCIACEVKVFGAEGSLLATTPLQGDGTAQSVIVPTDADQILLWASDTNSAIIPLDRLRSSQAGGDLTSRSIGIEMYQQSLADIRQQIDSTL